MRIPICFGWPPRAESDWSTRSAARPSRSGEVYGARWNEFDFANKLWTVPAARMKAGREHRIPLSDRALSILKYLQDARSDDFVFPGRKANKPLSNMAMEMMLRRMKMKVTVHGFRSAFRDWAGNEFWHREAANNGVPEAQMMMDRLLTLAGPSIRVMVCAGRLRANEGDLLGSQTIASLNNYDANRAIVGATGIAARGIYDADEEAGAVSAAMIQRAAEAIVVADHSKFDQLAASIYSRWEAIDRLVTDQPPAGALALTLHESGTEVTVAAI